MIFYCLVLQITIRYVNITVNTLQRLGDSKVISTLTQSTTMIRF